MSERKKKKRRKRELADQKDKVRRVEVFDISDGDDEMMVIDELMEWYLGEDVDRVRMVNGQRYERDWCEPVDAIRTTETRANITFEFQNENGRTLKVIQGCSETSKTNSSKLVSKLGS